MKAFALDAFGDTGTFRDMPEPVMGDGEVLVEVRAAGMTTTDLAVMAGYLAAFVPHHLPLIPGIDCSGVVLSVAPGVEGFAPGDQVFGYTTRPSFGQGTFAEQVALPATGLWHQPPGFGFAETSVIGHGSMTALATVEAAGISQGCSVVVLGATGGVGSYLIQMLHAGGAKAIAVTLAQYEGYARSLGADEVIDYDTTDAVGAIRALRPNGVEAVIDLAGIPELFAPATELVKEGGSVVSVVLQPDVEALKERGVNGVLATRFATDGRFGEIAGKIESRELKLPAIQIFDFADIHDALTLQATRHVHGKLSLRMP